MSESFVSGSSVPSQGATFSSSFDEPLASALTAELGHPTPSPPVLPMYPNGPTSARSSGRSAIPIRMATELSDNMAESLGRLKREIGRVKPAKPVFQRGVSRSVPLEFDEEDEDFLALDPPLDISAPLASGDQAALSTPSTDLEPLLADIEGDETWNEWDAEDKQTVDDAEQYDDIGVGYMDEEWMKSTH
ncbi:hypothetical protein EIP86_000005 [Pleurotus ostreatoroseus]|nr:hypothetical protein EIP86_000005 [Pleurotus ostreatoroseus]